MPDAKIVSRRETNGGALYVWRENGHKKHGGRPRKVAETLEETD